MTDEVQPPNPNLTPDDSDADADLARNARAQQFRRLRRTQLTMGIPALLLIALGGVYLLSPSELTPLLRLALAFGALGIGLVARFLLNGRRERGLVFVGTLILLLIGAGLLVFYQQLEIAQVWPFGLIAAGLAVLLTFLLERSHERSAVGPGLLLIVAGVVALLFTAQIVNTDILRLVASFWPVIFVLIALILLPRVFRVHAR